MPRKHSTTTITVAISKELKDEIKEDADAKDMTLSEFMRWLFISWKEQQ
ncbi:MULTISPECIES: ribbon-helix-helix protein, CopG family [Pirellulaceae]|nr:MULTISPECIES: ribbon-helix-helix protein, CopG family [Pirellulaceae]RCS48507.1 ribbon-helix-helix protein, CopG family [Bremerella cremea]